jgi:hypothetical protein
LGGINTVAVQTKEYTRRDYAQSRRIENNDYDEKEFSSQIAGTHERLVNRIKKIEHAEAERWAAVRNRVVMSR